MPFTILQTAILNVLMTKANTRYGVWCVLIEPRIDGFIPSHQAVYQAMATLSRKHYIEVVRSRSYTYYRPTKQVRIMLELQYSRLQILTDGAYRY